MFIPLPRRLSYGMRGKDVLAVQRAISRAGYRKWGVAFTGIFGPGLRAQIKRFQKQHGIPQSGVYGPKTHRLLARYFDRYGASLMIHSQQPKGVALAVAAAMVGYNHRYQIGYTQDTRRMMIVRKRLRPLAKLLHFFRGGYFLEEDCSSSVTGWYYIAALRDPNGLGFSGGGYTGTLAVHGKRVASPRAGDLCLYGTFPYRHTAIYVTSSHVVSHGSERGPLYLPARYRGDYSHARRYV